MNDSYLRNIIEAALLAAGGPLPVAELARLFDERMRPSAQAVRAALSSTARRGIVRRPRHRAQGNRERLSHSGAPRARGGDLAAVAGACRALFARAAGDSGADRVPPADHPRGDRGGARGRRQPQHHPYRDRAQLGAGGWPPRCSRTPGAARHDSRVSRLLRPAKHRRAAAARRAQGDGRRQSAARARRRGRGSGSRELPATTRCRHQRGRRDSRGG